MFYVISGDALLCPRCERELLPVTLEMIDLYALDQEPTPMFIGLLDLISGGVPLRSRRFPRLEIRGGGKRRLRKDGGWVVVGRGGGRPGARCGSCKVAVAL